MPAVNHQRVDEWCERAVLGLILAILGFGPLAFGGVRAIEFAVLAGLTLLVLLVWMARLWLNPASRLLWPVPCWGVLVFVAYAIGRYFFADLEYVARQELMRVVLYAALFLAAVNNLYHRQSIRMVVYGLVFLGTVEGCLAVYQFLTHATQVWGLRRPEAYWGRGSGTYICPNHLAGFLEMILPLALAHMVATRASPLARVFLGYAAIVMSAGLVLSGSRAGWVAAGVGLLVLTSLLIHGLRQWLVLVVLIGLLGGGSLYVYSKSLTLQVRMLRLQDTLDAVQRDVRYGCAQAAYRMWKDHPWFGVGPGHFDVRYRGYRAEKWWLQNRPGRAHNDYLNALADWGLLGTVLALAPLGWTGVSLARNRRRLLGRGEPASSQGGRLIFLVGATAALAALLVHSLADFNMHIPANAILAVVLAALLAAHLRLVSDRYGVSLTTPLRLAVSVLLTGGAIFLGAAAWPAAGEDAWLRRAQSEPAMSAARIAAFERALAIEPGHAETALLLGEEYRSRSWSGADGYPEEAAKAIGWFERAARLDPFDPLSRLGMAACHDWLGRHTEAEPCYQEALKRDPNGYRVRAQYGWHFFLLGDYAKAAEWLKKSAAVNTYDNPMVEVYLPLAEQKLAEQKARPPKE
jgi:O-antigen ligase